MRKLMIMLGCILFAGNVMATVDPDPDGIGVYFDMDGDVYCTTTAAPFANVVAYLLATNITATSGISGWEARVWTAGAAPVAPAWTLAAGLDVDDSPDGFQVGIGTVAPLPYGQESRFSPGKRFFTSVTLSATHSVEPMCDSSSTRTEPFCDVKRFATPFNAIVGTCRSAWMALKTCMTGSESTTVEPELTPVSSRG